MLKTEEVRRYLTGMETQIADSLINRIYNAGKQLHRSELQWKQHLSLGFLFLYSSITWTAGNGL